MGKALTISTRTAWRNAKTDSWTKVMDRPKEFQVKKYKQPEKGVISANCSAKRCSTCYKLNCSHSCHVQ